MAPEFEYHEKSAAWYWTTVVIALIILAFALWQQNFLFGFFVIMAEVLLVIWANKKPAIVEFVVGEKSIRADKRNYQYSELKHYSVDEDSDPDFTRIIFEPKQRAKVKLDIIIPRAQADEILDFLAEEAPGLPEIEYEVKFLDALERFLRF